MTIQLPVYTGSLLAPEPWTREGACLQVDPDLFFPDAGGVGAIEAKRVCGSCPVVVDCLEYAMSRREPHGIWGGLSRRERSLLRARRSGWAATDMEES